MKFSIILLQLVVHGDSLKFHGAYFRYQDIKTMLFAGAKPLLEGARTYHSVGDY